jgi:hypothetical protein
MSYAGAGAYLKGADEAKVTAFSTEEYKAGKFRPKRAQHIAGTTPAETAIRASYEPGYAINFDATNPSRRSTRSI